MRSIKFGTYFCMAMLTALFVGCDHDGGSGGNSSSDEPSGSLTEVICKVLAKSSEGVAFEPGDIGFYDCGAYRIIVTGSTTILRDRESCSGLAKAGFGAVTVGDTIFVLYRTENANFATKPTEIRATRIEAYPEGCINGTTLAGEEPEDDCKTCPDPFFD